MALRLLITSRDAAAAFHMIEIARSAHDDPRFEPFIHAQEPAARYFRDAGLAVTRVALAAAERADSASARALLDAAQAILDARRPDAVLCGLSTPVDGGLDEAMLARAAVPPAAVPRFVMQDFWGERNHFFGATGALYLALDSEAVRLSEERHGLEAIAVGSPRHAPYAALDMQRVRRDVRARLGVPAGRPVLGFFGQALHALPGYLRTVRRWAEAVAASPTPCTALYRPHPRESAENRADTRARLRAAGLTVIAADDGPVENAVLACDVICSAFSNCTYDAAYLNRYSERPLVAPVALFFDAEVVDYFRRIVHLREFPYLKAGLVMLVREADGLVDALREATQPAAREALWSAARRLPDPGQAAARVLDEIWRRAGPRPGMGS